MALHLLGHLMYFESSVLRRQTGDIYLSAFILTQDPKKETYWKGNVCHHRMLSSPPPEN
jgi:hypothetical protein